MLVSREGTVIDDISFLKDKKVIFYGASTRNRHVIEEFAIEDNVLFFVDGNSGRAGSKQDGYDIYTPDEIKRYPGAIVVSVLSHCMEDVVAAVAAQGENECYIYIREEFYRLQEAAENNRRVLEAGGGWKYVHLIYNQKAFCDMIYNMLEREFDIKEHLFIIMFRDKGFDTRLQFEQILERNRKNANILILDELYGIPKCVEENYNCNTCFNDVSFWSHISGAEGVILHSGSWGEEGKRIVKRLVDEYPGKCFLVTMGAEFRFEGKDREFLSYVVKRVACGQPDMYDILKEFSAEKRLKMAKRNLRTPSHYSYFCISKDSKFETDSDVVKVLLGISANPQMEHNKGIDTLAKYANENILVYCPLNYEVYSEQERDKVIQYGRKRLGEKFIPILEYQETESWYDFLLGLDFLVILGNAIRGGTTKRLCVAGGKTVYITAKAKRNFYPQDDYLQEFEDVENMNFCEFASNTRGISLKEIQAYNQKVVDLWGDIFKRFGDTGLNN